MINHGLLIEITECIFADDYRQLTAWICKYLTLVDTIETFNWKGTAGANRSEERFLFGDAIRVPSHDASPWTCWDAMRPARETNKGTATSEFWNGRRERHALGDQRVHSCSYPRPAAE